MRYYNAYTKDYTDQLVVKLRYGYENYSFQVCRLVYEAFVGPIPEGPPDCARDGDNCNNRFDNLIAMGGASIYAQGLKLILRPRMARPVWMPVCRVCSFGCRPRRHRIVPEIVRPTARQQRVQVSSIRAGPGPAQKRMRLPVPRAGCWVSRQVAFAVDQIQHSQAGSWLRLLAVFQAR